MGNTCRGIMRILLFLARLYSWEQCSVDLRWIPTVHLQQIRGQSHVTYKQTHTTIDTTHHELIDYRIIISQKSVADHLLHLTVTSPHLLLLFPYADQSACVLPLFYKADSPPDNFYTIPRDLHTGCVLSTRLYLYTLFNR